MVKATDRMAHCGELIQRNLLWLLLGVYALAAVWPAAGVAAKHLVVQLNVVPDGSSLPLPGILLAGLLFIAGLAVSFDDVLHVCRRPLALLAGFVANLVVPFLFLLGLSVVLKRWHSQDEARDLLIGLAVVAAMPVAGSSTSWAQAANGNVALSLGLVISSTLLSPLTSPWLLDAINRITSQGNSEVLHQLSGRHTGDLLVTCVVIPSILGAATRAGLGAQRIAAAKPALKILSPAILLSLCYINASSALPQLAANPDWDFLVMALAGVCGLSLSMFGVGWLLSRLLGVDPAQQRSLVFAMGMSNNGTGMVVASNALGAVSGAAIPVLAYNLVQHIVASRVCRRLTMLRA